MKKNLPKCQPLLIFNALNKETNEGEYMGSYSWYETSADDESITLIGALLSSRVHYYLNVDWVFFQLMHAFRGIHCLKNSKEVNTF